MSDFKIIQHRAIDFKKWDTAILNSKLPLVFAQSFYLNATAPNWKALVSDNYKIVMPLTEGKKLNVKYLFQPPFTPQLGVFGAVDKNDVSEVVTFLEKKYRFIEIELNAANKLQKPTLKQKQTFVIDFSKNYKQNENTRRNISKAQKNGIVITEIAYKEAFRLAQSNLVPWLNQELDIPKKHSVLLLDLITNANENKCLKALKAVNSEGEILSIGYFVFNKYHAVFLKGMSFNKKDNSGSMHLLMNYAINLFKNKVNVFDFGGGSASGLANFYKGLGGTELSYGVLKVNNLPWPLRIIKK